MTEAELRAEHPDLIPEHAIIDVRPEWLSLIDKFFSEVSVLYGDTRPSVRLCVAYERHDGLVIDCDDRPWTGNQDREIKQKVRQLAREFQQRSLCVRLH